MHSAIVLEHFLRPRNAGELEGADWVGESGSAERGIRMVMALRLEGERIAQVRFQTWGCGASIAACSVTTELAAGRLVSECLVLTAQEVSEALGGLPEHKFHCAELAVEALRDALSKATRGKG